MVFPVCNESFIIEQTLRNYIAEFQGRVPDFEVIVAEDGSTDDTKNVLERVASDLPIKLFMGDERKGYQQAVIDALGHATKEWVFVVDSDYQFAAIDFWRLEPFRRNDDVILGVTGDHHPLPIYLAARVPIALSTDDEGVSRIDLTHEYERAVTDFGFSYLDLKRSARTSIEHSFLPGADLWAKPDKFTRFVDACSDESSSNCSDFLKGSEKARQQWELERRFHDFELKQSQVVEAYPH